MSTVRLENSIFMHVPKCGGTALTVAFGDAGMVKFDYKYRLDNPIQKGYQYDSEGRLWTKDKYNKSFLNAPYNSAPHAGIRQLRNFDVGLPKFAVVMNPIDWYESFWTQHSQKDLESDFPYIDGGGYANFDIWISNMVKDSEKKGCGYYTRYLLGWADKNTKFVRSEYAVDDLPPILSEYGESLECIKFLKKSNNRKHTKVDHSIKDAIQRLDSTIYKW